MADFLRSIDASNSITLEDLQIDCHA